MRIGIIGLLHESNTFSAQPTQWANFEQLNLCRGAEVLDQFSTSRHELGGFINRLDERNTNSNVAIETVPIFAARALPSGTVTAECWERLLECMFSELADAAPLDGVLVAPHGATVSAAAPDADGNWLSRLRSHLGPDMPMIGTLDAHANLSPQMAAACDALVAYRTNPHLDQFARGEEAADLVVETVSGKIRPTMAAAFPPLVINIERQAVEEPHWDRVREVCETQRARPDILSNSVLLGFPYADVPEMGAATIAVTDNDPQLARQAADELADVLWSDRSKFEAELISVEQAMDRCLELESPVCLLDMGDNVGGGSAADGTALAAALDARGISPAVVCIFDPQSVDQAAQAGVGQQTSLTIGARTDDLHGSPLPLDVTVRGLYEGKFHETETRHGGFLHFDQGRTAVVESKQGLTVVLTSRRMVPFSLEQLRSCNLDPASFRILVAKGVNAPLAAYREVCRSFIRVDTPGACSADLNRFQFQNRRRPLYPFERDCPYQALTR